MTENEKRLLNFAKDMATNYDHEGEYRCYRSCHVCAAEKIIREVLGDNAHWFIHGPYYVLEAKADV